MTELAPFTAVEARRLLDVALDAVAEGLRGGRQAAPAADLPSRLLQPGASFVTFERDGGELLGCIGSLEARQPLAADVAEHAVAAAFLDPRLPPVTGDDYAAMVVKISVLTAPEPFSVASWPELQAALEPGRDGLVVRDGDGLGATFLPSVWGQLPEPDSFLTALWRKAGWSARAWPPGLHAARYRAVEICDRGPRARPRAA